MRSLISIYLVFFWQVCFSFDPSAEPGQKDTLNSYEQGIQQLNSSDFRAALVSFQTALSSQANNHRLHYLIGFCQYQLGEYDASVKELGVALKGDSLSSLYHLSFGRAYSALGQPLLALAEYEKALSTDNDSHLARLELLRTLCQLKRFEKAKTVLSSNPNLDEILVLGRSLLSAGKPEDALPYASLALSKDSSGFATRLLLADTYYSLQRYDDAFSIYAFLMMENQGSATIARKMAFCYERQGARGIPVAVMMMQKYMRLSGDTTASDLAKIGSWFYVRQKYDSAATYFKMAVQRDSTIAEVHYNYGLALFHLSKLVQAEQELKLCAQLSQGSLQFQSSIPKNIAAIYLQKKEISTAIANYRRALDINPSNFDAMYGLASSYDIAGEATQAARWYRRFLEHATPANAGSELIEKVNERLNELDRTEKTKTN